LSIQLSEAGVWGPSVRFSWFSRQGVSGSSMMNAREMHVYDRHAHEVYTHEMYAREMHDYKTHAHKVRVHRLHAHELRCTHMRCTPVRCKPVSYTPMRYALMGQRHSCQASCNDLTSEKPCHTAAWETASKACGGTQKRKKSIENA
jgi:hypothetical protein